MGDNNLDVGSATGARDHLQFIFRQFRELRVQRFDLIFEGDQFFFGFPVIHSPYSIFVFPSSA